MDNLGKCVNCVEMGLEPVCEASPGGDTCYCCRDWSVDSCSQDMAVDNRVLPFETVSVVRAYVPERVAVLEQVRPTLKELTRVAGGITIIRHAEGSWYETLTKMVTEEVAICEWIVRPDDRALFQPQLLALHDALIGAGEKEVLIVERWEARYAWWEPSS